MTVRRGDVILVDYPFTDRAGSKVRPALVVQADTLNQAIADTIIVSISGSTHRASATQLVIDPATAAGRLTGLRQVSTVQCENLLTVDQQFILRTIGRFPPNLLLQIEDCLKAALELP